MEHDIDKLIEQTKTMDNVSKGGSACYFFGDVVLVKYRNLNKYGSARVDEEQVSEIVNRKNAEGVRTPKHIAIKREVVGEENYCWVLQETAKGKCYKDYCNEADAEKKLENQAIMANAPDSHYEQMALDLKSLLYVGLEIKPKNIFYDESSVDGGFTFIDFICPKDKEYDGGLVDSLMLMRYMFNVVGYSIVYKATEEQKQRSKELANLQFLKCFKAMEKAVPEISSHRRWMLRALDQDVLKYFEENGVEVGDLTLTEQEEAQFSKYIDEIVTDCVEMVSSGEYKYWQIAINEVCNKIADYKLANSYKYSKNCKLKASDYESDYEYEYALKKYLEQYTLNKFEETIENMVELNSSNNKGIINAYSDIKEKNHTV